MMPRTLLSSAPALTSLPCFSRGPSIIKIASVTPPLTSESLQRKLHRHAACTDHLNGRNIWHLTKRLCQHLKLLYLCNSQNCFVQIVMHTRVFQHSWCRCWFPQLPKSCNNNLHGCCCMGSGCVISSYLLLTRQTRQRSNYAGSSAGKLSANFAPLRAREPRSPKKEKKMCRTNRNSL